MSEFWRNAAYTRPQWIWAVIWSATVVWFLFALGFILTYAGEDLSQFSLEVTVKAVAFIAAFLFLSIQLLSWIIIAPLLRHRMKRPISWAGAMAIGAPLGMFLYFAILGCGFIVGPLLGRSLELELRELPIGVLYFSLGGVVVSAVIRGFLWPGIAQITDEPNQ